MTNPSQVPAPFRLIGLCRFVDGVACLVLFNYSTFVSGTVPAFISFAVFGIASIGFFVQLTTLLQSNTPEAYRGRIFGLYGMVWALFLLLGTILTGLIGDRTSIIFLLDVQSFLFFPAAIIGLIMLRPHIDVPAAQEPGKESIRVTT